MCLYILKTTINIQTNAFLYLLPVAVQFNLFTAPTAWLIVKAIYFI